MSLNQATHDEFFLYTVDGHGKVNEITTIGYHHWFNEDPLFVRCRNNEYMYHGGQPLIGGLGAENGFKLVCNTDLLKAGIFAGTHCHDVPGDYAGAFVDFDDFECVEPNLN